MDDHLNLGNMYAYDMFDGDIKVGICNISIHPQHDAFKCPDSWKGKPVMEIDAFGSTEAQDHGFGRAGLQQCYEKSLELGCEGRIVVHATWGAGSFYEHCGFQSDNLGKPGIKYFEPTPENLAKLFKGERKTNFSFRESIPDFNIFNGLSLDDFPTDISDNNEILPKEAPNNPKIKELERRLNNQEQNPSDVKPAANLFNIANVVQMVKKAKSK